MKSGVDFGSVCSGIEAASVAWHPLGWRAAWLSEIDPFACKVLAHRLPSVPNLGDMTTLPERIRAGEVPAPSMFTGGTPCQAFSVAGRRTGLADARGNLTMVFVEIADAIDDVRSAAGDEAGVVLWENVPGVFSSRDNAFGCFLGALAGSDCALQPPGKRWGDAGCVFGPRRSIAWRTFDAQFFGLAQRRRRVFVIASARENFNPDRILFEFEGVRRDSAPSRETREETPTSPTLRAGGNRTGGDRPPGTDVDTCDSLQVVAFSCKDHGADAGDVSPTLRAMGHGASHANAGGQVAVAFTGDIAHTLNTANNGKGCSEDGTGRGVPTVAVGLAVRRLMPRECERLQGIPDDWTLIPVAVRKKITAERFAYLRATYPELTASDAFLLSRDGPRYKVIGNSWAVDCARWIGERLQRFVFNINEKDSGP